MPRQVPDLDPAQVGERIDALLGELRVAGGGRAAERAEELTRLLVEMYGTALARIVDALDALDPELVRRLATDPLLGSLFVLHDLHPDDVESRIVGALDRVRPYLGSHAGGVEYLGLDDGVVRLRLEGSCDGCPSSLVTVRLAIEAAIEEAAPEVAAVVVEGVTDAAPRGAEAPVAFLPSRGHADTLDDPSESVSVSVPVPWVTLPTSGPATGVRGVVVDGFPVLLVGASDTLYAYRNVCAACGSALDGGRLEATTIIVCPDCGERFDVQLAGRAVGSAGSRPIEPLPLIPEADGWKIALPVVLS